jgi:hypothetical protein
MKNLEFDCNDNNHKKFIFINFSSKIRFMNTEEKGVRFAFEIDGKLYRPQLKDIKRIQRIYGVSGYRCVAEYMKGETLELIRTHY